MGDGLPGEEYPPRPRQPIDEWALKWSQRALVAIVITGLVLVLMTPFLR